MTGVTVRSLEELYRDTSLYSSPDMFSPPAERLGHVLRFELTQGCSWGRCSFCDGYDGIKYHAKSKEEYVAHIREVWRRVGPCSELANGLTRVFIGGGNVLSMDSEALSYCLNATLQMFEACTLREPKRIAVFGRTDGILNSDLHRLRRNHLDLVYWGVESGADEILAYVNKGCSHDEMVAAGKKLRDAEIGASVMIMPGLGGIKFSQLHAENTAALLNEIRPRYITFIGVNAKDNSPYAKRMMREVEEGENRPLTMKETAQQMSEMIRRLKPDWTKLGCFDETIDGVGSNPVTFGSYDFYYGDYPRKLWLLFILALKIRSLK